jgi:hypothetical protein
VRSADREPGEAASPGRPTLTASPKQAAAGDAGEESARRWRPTVWFNPWHYQTGEQVWAGLVHEIIGQTTSRMSVVQREHFWLRLNLRRVDEQAVRQRIYQLVLTRAAPGAVWAVLLAVVGVLGLALGAPRWVSVALTGGGPVVLATALAVQILQVLRSRVTGTLSRLVAPSTTRPILADAPVRQFVRAPDYEGRTGFLYLVQSDLQEVLDLVATAERPLVVLIDDLDRCSPGTVVNVIEAINVFLAGSFANVVFIVAMEPHVVAAHIETMYGDLAGRLQRDAPGVPEATGLGWRFLEKFIQLPLTLPGMERDQTTMFLNSLFPRHPGTDSSTGQPVRSSAAAAEPDLTPAAGPAAAQTLRDDLLLEPVAGPVTPAAREAVRRFVEQQLSLENPDIQAVIAYGTRMLRPNPRDIKRFLNMLRFFVMIHTERGLLRMASPESLEALAKLAVLATRWPWLIPTLLRPAADELTVLQLLEDSPGGDDGALQTRLAECGISDSTIHQLLATDLLSVVATDPKIAAYASTYL